MSTTKFMTDPAIAPACGDPMLEKNVTNGDWPASYDVNGISSDSSSTEPTLKIAMRSTTVLMARGMTLAGSAVSPAAVPTSSMAAYANTAPEIASMGASAPAGKKPPLPAMTGNPVAPASVAPPRRRKPTPNTRNSTSAPTLTAANQNSISPNTRTDTRLRASTTTSAMRATSHCGMPFSGGRYCPQNRT